MSEIIISTQGLSKKYRSKIAVDHADITVMKGRIYGLVGKNGAGKTTLMRMLTAQTLADSGHITLFGESSFQGLNKMRRRIGSIIETPSFYPYLSAEQNLEYYRIQRGIPGGEIIEKSLKEVELTGLGNKKFKNFSLGMKQRLGLALAIMNHPDLLILDEPINGLDPSGIVQLRSLLLKLNREKNMTIMISSHFLSELQNMATDYAFMKDGRILEEITESEMRERCKEYIELVVDDTAKASAILEKDLHSSDYEVLPENTIRLYGYLDTPQEVSSVLAGHAVQLLSMKINQTNLEDYFLALIGGSENA